MLWDKRLDIQACVITTRQFQMIRDTVEYLVEQGKRPIILDLAYKRPRRLALTGCEYVHMPLTGEGIDWGAIHKATQEYVVPRHDAVIFLCRVKIYRYLSFDCTVTFKTWHRPISKAELEAASSRRSGL